MPDELLEIDSLEISDDWEFEAKPIKKVSKRKKRQLPREIAIARYNKACATSAKNAHIEWVEIFNSDGYVVYHLRSRGLMRCHLSRPTDEAKSYYNVIVKKDAVSFKLTKGRHAWATTIKFKNGKMRVYRIGFENKKATKVTAVGFSLLKEELRRFSEGASGANSKGSEVEKVMVAKFFIRAGELVADLAAKNNLVYDKSLSIERNFVRFNYPVFAGTYKDEITNAKQGWQVIKLFKPTEKKTVKYIAGSNTKKVTKLFFSAAVGENNYTFLSKCVVSYWVRRFWGVDFMQRLWAAPEFMVVDFEKDKNTVKVYREILKRIAPANVLNYFTDPANQFRDLRDSAAMIMQRRNYVWPERIRNIRELHDSLIPRRDRPTLTFDEDYDLECPKQLGKVDGLKFDDYEIKAPKSSKEMREWGNGMSNCIGSYAYGVKGGQYLILGVLQADEIKYGIELTPELTLVQFRGRFNAEPSEEERKLILNKIGEIVALKPFISDWHMVEL